jgi:hypothetical protein
MSGFLVSNCIFLSAKETCSREIDSRTSKRDTTGLISGGFKVRGRKFPWAGAFFYKEHFQCGGNLSKHILILYG